MPAAGIAFAFRMKRFPLNICQLEIMISQFSRKNIQKLMTELIEGNFTKKELDCSVRNLTEILLKNTLMYKFVFFFTTVYRAIEILIQWSKELTSKVLLKLVSAMFYEVFIFAQNDSPSKTLKSVFYFI